MYMLRTIGWGGGAAIQKIAKNLLFLGNGRRSGLNFSFLSSNMTGLITQELYTNKC